jgi:hypothetical protein
LRSFISLFVDRNASFKNETCRPSGQHVFLNQFLQANFSVSLLSSSERVFVVGAVSLALRVAAEAPMPVSMPLFDERLADSLALPHAGSQSGAAVRGSPSLIAFFCWSWLFLSQA